MNKIISMILVVAFCLLSGGIAFANGDFSSPAAASNFSQYGDLSSVGNTSLLISFVEQNNASEITYKSYGCSTGCSVGCSVGCNKW